MQVNSRVRKMALEILLLERDVGARALQTRTGGVNSRTKLCNRQPRVRDGSLGFLERDAVGTGVEAEQQVACGHRLVLANRNLRNPARHIGADRQHVTRAQVANREVTEALEELGAIVDDVSIYKTVADTDDRFGTAAQLAEEGADWITFASGSSVENFHARFNLPELARKFPHMRFASIGPETSKAIRKLDLEPHAEAKPHTIEGLVNAVSRNSRSDR